MNQRDEYSVPASSSSPISSTWLLESNLFFNKHFFKKGLIIITPDAEQQSNVLTEKKSFVINDREFVFYKPGSKKSSTQPPPRSIKKAQSILSSLIDYSETDKKKLPIKSNDSIILFNKKRKDEVFFPIFLNADKPHLSLYLYPWIAKADSKYQFSGFSQFVSAGCLFGSAMIGVTQDQDEVALINHHLVLRPNQQITRIYFDKVSGNPFEEVLFSEFEKNCLFIQALSKKNQPCRLHYHLPAYDYVLFGLKLFIQKKINEEALTSFIKEVIERKSIYEEKLGSICEQYSIEVNFSSPFNNLFLNSDLTQPIDSIFQQLGISLDEHPEEVQEYQFTKQCLLKLYTNNIDPVQHEVWRDFIHEEADAINTIESLFKFANAVFVATASKNNPDYSICSLLPLSEKQIQIQYENCRSKINQRHSQEIGNYPATINITLFEPVITYSATSKGLLFYFSCYLNALSLIINNKKILHYASHNLGLFYKKTQPDGTSAFEDTDDSNHSIDLESLFLGTKS